ncbi:MAG: alpha/beta hydrolase [Candidatus Levybacteria bacterium]|nr:alpha/beta hydrolase [Candidatus Levybacteria bacterium]
MKQESEILFAEIEGEGKETIVFLPGILSSIRFWEPVKTLLKKNYTTVVFDLLGFGQSPKPDDCSYTLDEHASALFSSVKKYKLSTPVILVGHSMGALIALHFAAKHPTLVKKLVLVSPPIYPTKQLANRFIQSNSFWGMTTKVPIITQISCYILCRYTKPFTRLWLPLFHPKAPKALIQDSLNHTWHSVSKSLINILQNQGEQAEKDIKELKIPLRIVYGLDDTRMDIDSLEKLIRDYAISVTAIPHAGHTLPFTHPEIIASTLT